MHTKPHNAITESNQAMPMFVKLPLHNHKTHYRRIQDPTICETEISVKRTKLVMMKENAGGNVIVAKF